MKNLLTPLEAQQLVKEVCDLFYCGFSQHSILEKLKEKGIIKTAEYETKEKEESRRKLQEYNEEIKLELEQARKDSTIFSKIFKTKEKK